MDIFKEISSFFTIPSPGFLVGCDKKLKIKINLHFVDIFLVIRYNNFIEKFAKNTEKSQRRIDYVV